ncbi:hypothetical protein EDC01DRAFT_646869 [Geopyxis carbonaria]|nr:hypothetical protein EDC01DRAFT_646869 [Geopyxis carbonaria]
MSSPHGVRPSRVPLPENVVYKILRQLPTTSLFTASLVSSSWRKLIYNSGPLSQRLLKPHLSILRQRFGPSEVPHKLPIPTVRKLLLLYAKQELFGTFSSTYTYNTSAVVSAQKWTDSCSVPMRQRNFAVCGTLIAFALKNKRVQIFETSHHPMKLLATVKVPARAISIAISETYLSVLDEKRVHLYQLLARDSPSFMVLPIYSIEVPNLRNAASIAMTPNSSTPPLVAVLGTELYLIHSSHALSEKRGDFFSHDLNDTNKPVLSEKSASQKTPERPTGRQHQWILTAPGSSIGASFPISFAMRGRQLIVSAYGPQNHSFQRSAYLGSAWSNEDPAELGRRRLYGLKDGQDLATRPHGADELFRHFRSRTGGKGETATRRWMPKHLDTAEMEIQDAVHLWDAYYLATDAESGHVRIISVAPFESRFLLYRRTLLADAPAMHCGYAAFPGLKSRGSRGPLGGYLAFSPAPGRLNILPMELVPWQRDGGPQNDVGWELVRGCRDIAIGAGEILGMCAARTRVVVVFEDRVVVVRLWTEKVGGVEDEDDARWAVDAKGAVRTVEHHRPRMFRCGTGKASNSGGGAGGGGGGGGGKNGGCVVM